MQRQAKTFQWNETIPATRTTADYQSSHLAHHVPPMHYPGCVTQADVQVMTRAKGIYIWDNDGNRYLDGMSGMWCTAVGYGREELAQAAAQQMRELSYASLCFANTHPAIVEYSERLFEVLPSNFSHICHTNSGSEANETLIRTVSHFWKIMGKPEKTIFIARENGYHGSTVGSASLGGMKNMHTMGNLPMPDVVHIGEPHWFSYKGELNEHEFGLAAAGELEQRILELGADKVAAFVAEPFQGAGGMIFPPASYWPEIQRICRKYDVLICADEVVGGFGRTGEWFSHQHFGFVPDTLSIAKGMTSGYIPMGGLVLCKRIADAIMGSKEPYAHGFTYQAHPVAAAVALANLNILQRENIVQRVKRDTGPYLHQCLQEAFGDHPLVADIQGTGLIACLQLGLSRAERTGFAREDVTNAVGEYCSQAARNAGLIVRAIKGRVIMAPPLVITRQEIDELVDKLKLAVDQTAEQLGMSTRQMPCV